MLNPNNNSFYERVYEVVRSVPYGKVTSYGAIARYLGTAGSARLVGWAMNKSPTPALPEGEGEPSLKIPPKERGRKFQRAGSPLPLGKGSGDGLLPNRAAVFCLSLSYSQTYYYLMCIRTVSLEF